MMCLDKEILMKSDVADYLRRVESFLPDRSDSFPEMTLYMEQLLGWINGRSTPFEPIGASGDLLTSNMVNNYVKDKLIKPPINRRYGTHHLAALSIFRMLKQVLSVGDISAAIDSLDTVSESDVWYDSVVSGMMTQMIEVCRIAASRCEGVDLDSAEERAKAALEFAGAARLFQSLAVLLIEGGE